MRCTLNNTLQYWCQHLELWFRLNQRGPGRARKHQARTRIVSVWKHYEWLPGFPVFISPASISSSSSTLLFIFFLYHCFFWPQPFNHTGHRYFYISFAEAKHPLSLLTPALCFSLFVLLMLVGVISLVPLLLKTPCIPFFVDHLAVGVTQTAVRSVAMVRSMLFQTAGVKYEPATSYSTHWVKLSYFVTANEGVPLWCRCN